MLSLRPLKRNIRLPESTRGKRALSYNGPSPLGKKQRTPESIPERGRAEPIPAVQTAEPIPYSGTPESIPERGRAEPIPAVRPAAPIQSSDTPESIPVGRNPESIPVTSEPSCYTSDAQHRARKILDAIRPPLQNIIITINLISAHLIINTVTSLNSI